MILALLFGYLTHVEPFSFQKEASARSLMGQIGREDVKPEYQSMTEAAQCRLDQMNPEGRGRLMVPEAALICTFDSPCGKTVERVVWRKRLIGAFTSAEPTRQTIFDACPEMLNSTALKYAEDHHEQGG